MCTSIISVFLVVTFFLSFSTNYSSTVSLHFFSSYPCTVPGSKHWSLAFWYYSCSASAAVCVERFQVHELDAAVMVVDISGFSDMCERFAQGLVPDGGWRQRMKVCALEPKACAPDICNDTFQSTAKLEA